MTDVKEEDPQKKSLVAKTVPVLSEEEKEEEIDHLVDFITDPKHAKELSPIIDKLHDLFPHSIRDNNNSVPSRGNDGKNQGK